MAIVTLSVNEATRQFSAGHMGQPTSTILATLYVSATSALSATTYMPVNMGLLHVSASMHTTGTFKVSQMPRSGATMRAKKTDIDGASYPRTAYQANELLTFMLMKGAAFQITASGGGRFVVQAEV